MTEPGDPIFTDINSEPVPGIARQQTTQLGTENDAETSSVILRDLLKMCEENAKRLWPKKDLVVFTKSTNDPTDIWYVLAERTNSSAIREEGRKKSKFAAATSLLEKLYKKDKERNMKAAAEKKPSK